MFQATIELASNKRSLRRMTDDRKQAGYHFDIGNQLRNTRRISIIFNVRDRSCWLTRSIIRGTRPPRFRESFGTPTLLSFSFHRNHARTKWYTHAASRPLFPFLFSSIFPFSLFFLFFFIYCNEYISCSWIWYFLYFVLNLRTKIRGKEEERKESRGRI